MISEPVTQQPIQIEEEALVAPLSPAPVDSKQQTPLPYRVSQETTFFTGPLREDGSVDYVAALNRSASDGVTPETNAAVPLFNAIGLPDERFSDLFRDRFFVELGIPVPPRNGRFFVSTEQFAEQSSEQDTEGYANELKGQRDQSNGQNGLRLLRRSTCEFALITNVPFSSMNTRAL